MPAWLVNFFLGWIAPYIAPFIKNLREARADDSGLFFEAYDLVRTVAKEHPEWSGTKKMSWVLAGLGKASVTLGKDVGESLLRTIAELALQRAKREDQA